MITAREAPHGNYGTHLHPLLIACRHTAGPVIELGSGGYSTAVLHEVCAIQRRQLITYENNEEWLAYSIDMATPGHQFRLIKKWSEVEVIDCGVVLVDHTPVQRRVIEMAKFRNKARILVVHDTNRDHVYKFSSVFPAFKYRATYERYTQTTTLFSNFVNVKKLI